MRKIGKLGRQTSLMGNDWQSQGSYLVSNCTDWTEVHIQV